MVKHVWAWTHDAHVALQYVEELWKLVDIGLAHKVAKGKLAWVVLGSLCLVGIFVHVHGTELQTVEDVAIQTRSCLFEEDSGRTLNLDERAMIGMIGKRHRQMMPLTKMSKDRLMARLDGLSNGSMRLE